jgi:homeobox protein cut-like
LEQLLLARNKKLSNELTILRVSHNDLQKRLAALEEEKSSLNMELEKSRSLAATLENDLLKVQQEAANAFDPSARSVAGTYTSRYPASTLRRDRGGRTSPTSSIISGFDPGHSSSGSTLESLRAGEAVGGGSGILPMVTAQRDRFKKKNSELETELQKQYQTVSSLRSEIASLQKDNLSLYEKTRYVSTYNRGGHFYNGTASSSSAYAANPNPSSINITSPGGLATPASADIRYQSAYESHISPFARFRGRESARALKHMSLPERIVFQITRMVLATRTSRNLFAAYCLALHLLILVMLYWMGSADVASSMSHLSESVSVAGPGPVGGLADTVGGLDAAGQWHEEAPPAGG